MTSRTVETRVRTTKNASLILSVDVDVADVDVDVIVTVTPVTTGAVDANSWLAGFLTGSLVQCRGSGAVVKNFEERLPLE